MATDQFCLLKRWDRIWSQFLAARSGRRRIGHGSEIAAWRGAAEIELLEPRTMLSAFSALNNVHATPTYEVAHTAKHATSVSYSPSQIQAAYGFNKTSYDGTGQTIAIVDAYDDPTIKTDLALFDSTYSLVAPPSISVLSQTGSTSGLPSTDPSKGWEVEESLDVEWAHALAPGAKIVLVEANSASEGDLFTAVATAANLPGVSVVSMSFGSGEFSGEASYDSVFTTPSGHQGVTFLASTGDNGAPGGFPAYSSNVVAVGGTTLSADSSGNYISESGWSGSGGGVSAYESQPSYQQGVVTQSTTNRAIPDVSFDADPNSGVSVCDSFTNGSSMPWMTLGGTSFSAPAWGAVISIVNQARVANGSGTLDGASQTLPLLYQLSQTNPSAFRDVTSGNNGHAVGPGYDLVTGLGSPVVNVLATAMGGAPSTPPSSQLVFQHAPASATAGVALTTFSVAVENQNAQVLKSDSSTVTLTLSSGTFSTGQTTATASTVNGIATFSGLIIDASGSYTLTASDASKTGASSSVNINPAAAHQPAWQSAPSSTAVAGTALNPVTVLAEDAFGNLVTSPTSVTMKITGGRFSNGSTTATASAISGVATFSSLIINATGSYTLTASVSTQSTSASSVTVTPAAASKLVWQAAPASTAVAGATLNPVVVLVEDAFGNVVTGDSSTVTLTLSTGTFSTGSATATATAVNGIATFSSLAINTTGSYRITASDAASLTTVTSGNITVSPSTLSSLAFQQNPTTGIAGSALSPMVKVQALDPYGNLVKVTTTVTLTLTGGTFADGGTTETANTSAGVATFSRLVITAAGNYTLTASVDSLVGPSFGVAISPALAKQPVWQTAPSATAVAGVALSSIVVAVNDAYGNLVTTSPTVTMRLTGGKFSTGSTMVTATSVSGIATFTNLSINIAGNYTLTVYLGSQATSASSLIVSPAAASKLVLKTAPSARAVAGTTLNSVSVAVEDAFGNIVTTDASTVTLTLSSGTFSNGSSTATATAVSGFASFSNLEITATGTYQITASDSASLTTATSGNVVITPDVQNSLVIQQNPTTGTAGVNLAPAVKVAVLDQFGNLVTASTQVTLTLTGGTFSNRTTTAMASSIGGVATFSNLNFKVAGSYSLTASTSALSGPSFNVTVSPAAAAKLIWQTSPATTAVAGTSLVTTQVAVEDAFGNVVTTDTSSVTLTLASGSFNGGSSTASATAVNGIATFSNLAINTAGSYRITASDSASLTTVTSGSITISPDVLNSLVVQQNPTTGTAGAALNPTVKVATLDQFGNLVKTSTTVTLTLSSGTFNTGSSTATATTVNGVAMFSGLIIDIAGTYTLTASVNSLTSPSFSVVINPGSAKQIVWQTAPSSTGVAGTALSPVLVAVEDAFGNLVSTPTMVTLRLTGGKFSNGSTSVMATASGGVATFSNLQINVAGTYTLTAVFGLAATDASTVTISAASSVKRA